METNGNADYLRTEIKKVFALEFEEFKKSSLKAFSEDKTKIEAQHKAELKKLEQEIEKDKKNAFKAALSEEKLSTKKEFENNREELIKKVFDKASDDSADMLLGKDYIKMVKEYVKGKEGIGIIGGYEDYKKHFPDIEINKLSSGIIVKEDKSLIDFTFKTFIEIRKLELRHKIANLLFEE